MTNRSTGQSTLSFLANTDTTTTLAGGGTFTGGWTDVRGYDSVVVYAKSDVAGTMYAEFSITGGSSLTADSTLTYTIAAGVNSVHRLVITRPFFRLRYVNGSAAQSSFQMGAIVGTHAPISAPLNTRLTQYSDAIVTRTIDPALDIAAGRFNGFSLVNKMGRNADIDSGTLPEDICCNGGTYPGFPVGAPEELEVFSDNAGDTGTITFLYLASSTSTAYQTGTATLNGTTPVNTGVTAWRVHSAWYNSGSSTAFNLGIITLRHRVTTTNVFQLILAGNSQSYSSGYTVPYGSTAYIRNIKGQIRGGAANSIDTGLWVREYEKSPRLRRPFTLRPDFQAEEFYGGLPISQQSDIIIRAISTSGNNLEAAAGYDLILVSTL